MRSRETSSTFSENPNAFLIILTALFRKEPRNDQETTGFIRYSEQLFWKLQNVVLLMVFDVLQSRKMPSTFSEKRNAFWTLLSAIFRKGPQKHQ